MILTTNLLVLIATAICMRNNILAISFGRFLYGMAAGSYSVFVPKFINEVAPLEYKGPFGGISQFMLTLGIFMAALICIPIPSDPQLEKTDPASFIVQ